MEPSAQLEEIKKKWATQTGPAAADIQYLLSRIETLEKKAQVLLNQNMELTQEMESIRSDFGSDPR